MHVNHQDNLDSLDPRSDLRFGIYKKFPWAFAEIKRK